MILSVLLEAVHMTRSHYLGESSRLISRPHMIGESRLHGWRDAESVMDSSEIVKHEMQ